MSDKAAVAISLNIIAAGVLAAAIYMMANSIQGWGWLLFIAVLFMQEPSDLARSEGKDK